MKSRFLAQGYVLNDNRNSGGKKAEDDILGCAHCQCAMEKTLWQRFGYICSQCDGFVCTRCAEAMRVNGCENFKRRVELALEQAYRRDQNLRTIGAA